MRKPEIIVIDNGFAIVTAKATDTVFLDEVRAIVACKIDELTTDPVCCDIVTGFGTGEQICTFHEEIPGFDAVILPPFATNRTTIYIRAENAA